ncbi:MAG: ribonuclease III [Deltaproteobacteria bacterium]|nr:ribonuclease III [Deltaproteobacteria bacterium]
MSPESAVTVLEQRLGREFESRRFGEAALTHSTYVNEHPEAGPANERLEFVGDAVLGLLAAELLFNGSADGSEGEMTVRRAQVVERRALAEMATRLDLGALLRMGEGQRRDGGALSSRILAGAYEAVAGAVFMDGGYDAAKRCFAAPLQAAIDLATTPVDFKTALQELCHRRRLQAPAYTVTGVHGPDHARTYTCGIVVGDVRLEKTAANKKDAEQACARAALAALGGT